MEAECYGQKHDNLFMAGDRGLSRNPGRGVLTRMLSMNGVWSCMQLVGWSSRRLGSAQPYRVYCMINFSSADASELHLFFDRANLIILSHQNKGKSKK